MSSDTAVLSARKGALVVVLVALIARVWALLDGMDSPTFDQPIIDAKTYDAAARDLASTGQWDYRFFWQPFLYPTWLALVYKLSSGSILAAKILQLVVGVATCGLTAKVGARLLGPVAGMVAGLIVALHGPMIFFEGELLATGWAAFWGVLLLDRLIGLSASSSWPRWLLVGVVGALAVLTRPTFLPFVVVMLLFLVVRNRSLGAAAVRSVAIALAAFLLLTLPVAWLGARTANHASILPSSGAMNLYLGNSPEPCETLTVRPGQAWRDLALQAEPQGKDDLAANQRFFAQKLRDGFADSPAAVLRGVGRKALQFVSGRELPRNVDPYSYREWSSALSLLMWKMGPFGFPMGWIVPLAIYGVWRARGRLGMPALVFLLVYSLAVVAVFVSARYRLAMLPVVAVAASAGAFALVEELRRRRWISLGVLLALVVLAAAPGPFCEEEVDYEAEFYYAVGYRHHRAGDIEAAGTFYQKALERRPNYAELLNQLALVRNRQGRTSEAILYWKRGIEAAPDDIAARTNLGALFARQNHHAEALEQFAAILAREPRNATALLGSGFAKLGLAQFEAGVDDLVAALRVDPSRRNTLGQVAPALEAQGELELAARLRAAMR